MQASVTVPMAAQADEIWNIVADVRNTGKYSPEVIEAEWLDGATGPVYGTTCRVTACEPGREFGFEVLLGDRPVNNWHYRFTPTDDGTDVTESFRMTDSPFTKVFAVLGGQLRTRRNKRDMRKTLERIKGGRGGAR